MTNTVAEKNRTNGKNEAKVAADAMKTKVEDGIAQTQDALENAVAQTSDELRKIGDKSTGFVRENPGMAVAGAVTVGVLIGLALRGRS